MNKKWKKVQCSPYSKSAEIKGSCFTQDVLLDFQKTFNNHHPEKKIETKNPETIWKELQSKTRDAYKCNSESCWIQHLADSSMKTKLTRLFFAPPQPKEWKKNPTAWLSNFDILNVLRQYEQAYPTFYFIGPSYIDYDTIEENATRCVCPKLCLFDLQKEFQRGIRQIGIIFNLDTHDKSGSHWVSLFIDINELFVFYFDSNSDPIPTQIRKFAKKVIEQGHQMQPKIDFGKLHQNRHMEHQKQNTECGMYSLFFIITCLLREQNGKKLNTLELFALFKEKRIPDEKMISLRNTFFNKSIGGNRKTRCKKIVKKRHKTRKYK